MPDAKRHARPTIRCLNGDLGLDLPGLDVDLGDVAHPFMDELRRVAPESPTGQKRILSIDDPMVYRIRVSDERGATWVDEPAEGEERPAIVWLCAVQRREDGSEDDAFQYFLDLHTHSELLPSGDDRLRYRAEAAIRLFRGLEADLLQLVGEALQQKGTEHVRDLGEWLPCRILVLDAGGVEEIWCALSGRGRDDTFVSEEIRDLLFASLESRLAPAEFETRNDWPTGTVEWFEVVRLGMR